MEKNMEIKDKKYTNKPSYRYCDGKLQKDVFSFIFHMVDCTNVIAKNKQINKRWKNQGHP